MIASSASRFWRTVLVIELVVGGAACSARSATTGHAPSSPSGTGPAPTATSPAATAAGAPRLVPRAEDFPAAASTSSAALAAELEGIFAAPTLSTAVISGLVESLDTGEVLYRLNPDTLVVPASNMKIVTMAVGATRLGWSHRFETTLATTAPVDRGALHGDLIVVGSGDPTINARGGDRFAVFQSWASQLKAAGITRITGRIVGDDDAFEDQRFGDSWEWDDFAYDYAAPVGALQFSENSVEVVVGPGPRAGAPATVEFRPSSGGLVLGNVEVTTAAAGTANDVSFNRFPGRRELHVWGTIAEDSKERVLRAAVDNPTTFFVGSLRDVLRAEGVVVEGDAADIDEVPDAEVLKATTGTRTVLVRHQSPTLAEIGTTLMKVSQNLYAETVFRALSAGPEPASVKASREAAASTLRSWGIAPEQFAASDGSGLSRHNLVSATMMVRILRAMARDPQGFATFEATLPIAGRDGTLAGRMKATRAEGNAAAKTGTLFSVRSLSGYARTLDGERLVFSFIVNNFTVPTAAVDAVVDHAVERLANFRRE